MLALFALQRPATTIFGSAALQCWAQYTGLVLIVVGVAIRLAVIGFVQVPRDGDNKRAHAEALFTDGMFAISRNPLYVGNVTIYAGVFLMHGAPLIVLCGIGLFWLIYEAIIANEERFLRARFGDAYRIYCAAVPRWLPRRLSLNAVRAGMQFDLIGAIKTEYNVMGQAILIVALAMWYEARTAIPPLPSGVLMLGLVLLVALIKRAKLNDRRGP